MAMEILRAEFADLMQQKNYWAGVITEELSKEHINSVDKLYFKKSSETQDVKFTETSGFGTMQVTPEYGAANPDKLFMGYKKTIAYESVTINSVISRQAKQDEQWGVFDKRANLMVRAYHNSKGLHGASVLNTAFTTVGADGQYLIDVDHPLLDGSGTTSNKLATNATLGVSSLSQLITQMKYSVDARGKQIMIQPKYLVVPDALEHTGKQLIYPGAQPFTANNTHNTNADEGLELVVLPWLTSQTAWFLVAKPENDAHTLILFDRNGLITYTHELQGKAGDTELIGVADYKYDFNGFRNLHGSTGA
jgi:hypothetical protein